MSVQLTGVIYTSRITDEDRSGVELRNFQTLDRWCRHHGVADRVRLVTTMWDEVDVHSTKDLESTLKDQTWKSLLDAGALYHRFYNTPESAWEIVLELGDPKKTPLSLKKKFEKAAPRKHRPPKVRVGLR